MSTTAGLLQPPNARTLYNQRGMKPSLSHTTHDREFIAPRHDPRLYLALYLTYNTAEQPAPALIGKRLAREGEDSPHMDLHLVQQCTNVRNAHGYLTSLASGKIPGEKSANGHSIRRLYNLGYLRRCCQRSDETLQSEFNTRQRSRQARMVKMHQA